MSGETSERLFGRLIEHPVEPPDPKKPPQPPEGTALLAASYEAGWQYGTVEGVGFCLEVLRHDAELYKSQAKTDALMAAVWAIVESMTRRFGDTIHEELKRRGVELAEKADGTPPR